MKPEREIDYRCPKCHRITSKPWDAVWCLHHSSNFQPQPPSHSSSDWTRMERVLSVITEPLGDILWVIVEYQNSIGWDDRYGDKLPGTPAPGDLKWTRRIRSAPMPEAEARAEADLRCDELARPGWPRHMHGWEAWPLDLAGASWSEA